MKTDLLGKEKAGFKIIGKIYRPDWGIQSNKLLEAGGPMVSDDVEILCDIELINMDQEELIMNMDSHDDIYAKLL